MADIKKYAPMNFLSDFKIQFSCFRTKKTVAIAYGTLFVFLAFTIFLAFTPSSSNSSSLWFTNTFTTTSSSSSIFSQESYRSHVSSIVSYFFPNSSSSSKLHGDSPTHNSGSQNTTLLPTNLKEETPPPVVKNQTQQKQEETHKVEVLNPNNQTIVPQKSPVNNNNSTTLPKLSKGSPDVKNKTQNSQPSGKGEVLEKNQTQSKESHDKVDVLIANPNKTEDSLMKNQDNGTDIACNKQEIDDLMNCDLFDGNWVRDDSYPLYKPGSCSLIDEQFNCFRNARPDTGYQRMKWKPKRCTLPRLNGSHMLELLKGRRLVFVGDSLNRNMWESLICILKNSVKNKKKVYEESGRHHFRTEASYSFVFEDYKCTVEFFVSPFLVQEWEVSNKNGTKKETLRLDLIGSLSEKYKKADVIVFNTGHWWTHEKTAKGQDYYQEGSHVYSDLDVTEAFRKALTTWGRWVDANVNPMKSIVFFRGYSASHFSGGQWNSGGQCDHETEPIKNSTYLSPYPPKMTVLERVLKGMKSRVTYLNVTRMTDYRKDGHPSIYRKLHLSDEEKKSPLSFQDCSHWCLPGVPDAWNEILYAEILIKLKQKIRS